MLKSKKTILGALLCAIMALCLTLGAVGLMPKTEKAFADTGSVTIAYDGEETLSVSADTENLLESIGLNEEEWSFTGDKGGYSSSPYFLVGKLNLPGSSKGSTSVTMTARKGQKILSVKLTIAQGSVSVTAGGMSVSGSNGSYSFGEEGCDSFTIARSSGSVRITGFEVSYSIPTPPERKLQSIYIDGKATKLEYNDGESFDIAGLKVMGRYDDELGDAEITEGVEWTFSPDPLTAGTVSVNVTATAKSCVSDPFVVSDLTVTAPVTVGDVLNTLDTDFPTFDAGIPKDAWINEHGSTLCLDQTSLSFDGSSNYFSVKTSENLVKDGKNFTFTTNSKKVVTFYMDDNNKLVCIGCSGSGENTLYGTYYPQPQVDDTFTADGINYVVTSVGDTNTVKVGDNKSFAGNSVTIPATVFYNGVTFDVTEIGESAFEKRPGLNVTFAEGSKIETIGKNAFYRSKMSGKLFIPASVKTIGNAAFGSCNIGSVTFAENSQLTNIGASAFSSNAFTEITIPASVTNINEGAFDMCGELKIVTILATEVPTVGGNIFTESTKLEKIYVPAKSLEAYKTADRWSDYADKMEAFYTVADIVGTNPYFGYSPVTGWVNASKQLYCYAGSDKFYIQNSEQQVLVALNTSEILTKNQNDYEYSNSQYTIKFKMEDGVLTRITVNMITLQPTNIDGDYIYPYTAKPTVNTNQQFIYDGQPKTFIVPTSEYYTISDNTTQTNAGTYTVTVKLKSGYYWTGDTTTDLTFDFVIAQAEVTAPTVDTTQQFVYDGQPKTFIVPTSEYYTVSDNTTQTNAGTYQVTVALKDKTNYKWANSNSENLTFDFIINQKAEDVKVQDKNGGELTDSKVMIVSAVDGIKPGAVFVVEVVNLEKAEDTEQTETLLTSNNKIAQNEKIYGIYDAKLLLDGTTVQPNGTITIKMFVPEELRGKDFKLYHIHNGTEVMEIDNYEDAGEGYITFDVDKLSQFAFVGETPNENTCLSAGAIVGIVLGSIVFIVLVVYALGYFFLYRKGKLDDKKIKVIYKFLPKSNDNK